MNEKNDFATKAGRFIANMFITCICACISACVVALTVRFIMWLF